MILDHFKVLFHVIHELNKLAGEVYKTEQGFFKVFQCTVLKALTFLLIPQVPSDNAFTIIYASSYRVFYPCFLDHSRKTAHHCN